MRACSASLSRARSAGSSTIISGYCISDPPSHRRTRGAHIDTRGRVDLADGRSTSGKAGFAPGGTEGETVMTVKRIPDGYQALTPYLVVRGAAQAIDFY